MRKIRSNVFETNSSSMHSICINKNAREKCTPMEILNDVYVTSKGVVYLYDNDIMFGRSPFDILISPFEKVKYAIASYGEDKVEEITEIFRDIYNEAAPQNFYKNKDGYKVILFDHFHFPKDYDGETFYGNVDHQSAGLLQRFLKRHGITLKEFLMNPQYVVVIDGDEYYKLQRFKEHGLLSELEVQND